MVVGALPQVRWFESNVRTDPLGQGIQGRTTEKEMIMKTVLIPLLLMSTAVCTTPAFANYFANPQLGVNLNIGSAPNPKPSNLRIIETATYTAVPSAPVVAAVEAVAPTQTLASPVIVAETPPAPTPPPAINRFIVFFDFDKSNLTAESMQVVAQAVKTAKDSGMVRITVTGHTDTVGSQRYNQAL